MVLDPHVRLRTSCLRTIIGTAEIETIDDSPRFRIHPKVIISWAINDTTPGIPKMERREIS